ncbi:hypothetical protein [Kibdelosporangium philippinense]|nr:hypothetical protein [Kibdelosporangium philippinense]
MHRLPTHAPHDRVAEILGKLDLNDDEFAWRLGEWTRLVPYQR